MGLAAESGAAGSRIEWAYPSFVEEGRDDESQGQHRQIEEEEEQEDESRVGLDEHSQSVEDDGGQRIQADDEDQVNHQPGQPGRVININATNRCNETHQ